MFTSTPRNSHTSAAHLLFSIIIAALVFSHSAANAACPGEGDCCQANGSPGCNDEHCCELICKNDLFCCEFEWDSLCADQAFANLECKQYCSPPPSCLKDTGTGNCCLPNGSPLCEDLDCCSGICSMDPFCCATDWDDLCAEAANKHCTVCHDMCLGDINGDGVVDGSDLLIILSNWGQCPICHQCPADIAGNCTVDTADLLTVLNNWGLCNP